MIGSKPLSTSTTARAPRNIELLAIGSSTGGPKALKVLLKSFPEKLNVPIVIAQHMPAKFTSALARQLKQSVGINASEAVDQETLENGHVYIAPGDRHMRLKRKGAHQVCIEISDDEPVNFCRPSVDLMFESVAEVYSSRCIGVVLTGMGMDGLVGARALSSCGARIVVQDEASSVVWGMPGNIASAGLANEILPLEELGDSLIAMLENRWVA